MNVNISLKYQLNDNKRGIIIFYGVVLAIFILYLLTCFLFPKGMIVMGGMNGFEVSTIIFLFVVGLNSFRENFRMFMQNSISRKTMFLGRLLCVAVISIGMAMIDKIIAVIGKLIALISKSFKTTSLFEQIYRQRYDAGAGGFQIFIESLLFIACMYAVISMIGYFITALYYQMNKGVKVAVSVGVPVGLFTILPIVDGLLFHGAIGQAFGRFMRFAFGLQNGANPWMGILTMILTIAIFSGCSWLLIRRAAVRD